MQILKIYRINWSIGRFLLIIASVSASELAAQSPRVKLNPGVQDASASDKGASNRVAADRVAADRAAATQLTSTVAAIESSSSSLEIMIEPYRGAKSAPVITAMTSSHDGHYLALAGDDHVIRIYEVATNVMVKELVGHKDWIQTLAFSADSQELYSSGNDGHVLRWQHRYPVAPEDIIQLPFAIRSLSLSSYQRLLAVGGFSDKIGIFDLEKKRWKQLFQCDCNDQRCVRFSPDGTRLLCGGRDGCLRVWNVETGEELFNKRLHHSKVSEAAFSADATHVISVGEDRHVIQCEIATGNIRFDRELAQARLKSICLLNDDLAAIAGSDNSIRLYDLSIDDVIAKLDGHFGTVAIMCPCGNKLASGSFDTSVRIWDLEAEVARQRKQSMPVGLAPLDVDSRMRIR